MPGHLSDTHGPAAQWLVRADPELGGFRDGAQVPGQRRQTVARDTPFGHRHHTQVAATQAERGWEEVGEVAPAEAIFPTQ